MSRKRKFISLGDITRGHGLQGEVNFRPLKNIPGLLEQVSQVLLHFPDGREEEFNLRRSRGQGTKFLLLFEGITDRTAADGLRGATVLADRADLPQPPAGEYFPGELTGYTVVSATGELIGPVLDTWHMPANDVLQVDYRGREALIPVAESVIISVDHDDRRIVINVLEGLLD